MVGEEAPMSRGNELERVTGTLYFFLSYARMPKRHPNDPGDPDRWVCQLYDDLCESVLSLTNAHPWSVGFMDRQSSPGARWPEDLAQASKSLRRKLAGVPYRCWMAATGIPTLQDFGELLPQMTAIMLKRFRKDEGVPTYPPEGPPTERPRLRRADPEDAGGSK
jgi:hypothetical protein